MCKCSYCHREMTTAEGCEYNLMLINGEWYDRIRVGARGGLDSGMLGPGDRCGDCGALYGALHHPGCDLEACPRCGMQSLSCDCDPTELGMEAEE